MPVTETAVLDIAAAAAAAEAVIVTETETEGETERETVLASVAGDAGEVGFETACVTGFEKIEVTAAVVTWAVVSAAEADGHSLSLKNASKCFVYLQRMSEDLEPECLAQRQ